MNTVRAFLIGPMPAAFIGAIVSWLSGGFPRPISVAVFYLLLLYSLQLTFGAVIRAYWLKKRWTSGWRFTLAGMVMTGFPAALYLYWAVAKQPGNLLSGLILFFLWVILGGLTGAAHWWLARPDRLN